MFSKIIVTILAVILLANPLLAKELFIAPTGSDTTGTGSKTAPFATLVKAVAAAAAHDTITLRKGTYDGHQRIDIPWLTLRGYTGEKAIISHPYVEGKEDVTLRFWYNAHHATIKNLEITGGYYSVMFFTNWEYGPERAHHPLIENCNIHGSGYDAVKITAECDGAIIRNTEIHHTGMHFALADSTNEYWNCQGIDNVNADSMLVQDCYFHDIRSPALFFKGGATDCIVERVRIENCQYGVYLGASTDWEFHSPDVNPLYYQAIRGTVRNCIIRNTDDCGIGFFCTKDSKVYNNTLINCGSQANGEGVAIRFGAEGTENGTKIVAPANTNVQFTNNIVIRNSTVVKEWSNWMIYMRGADDNAHPALTAGSLNFDYNVYWDAKAVHHDMAIADNNVSALSTQIFTLAEWRKSSLHTGSAGEAHSFFANPGIDTISGQPLPGSICISTGYRVAGLIDDFQRNPRPVNGIDIGAAQFHQPTTGTTKDKNMPAGKPGMILNQRSLRLNGFSTGTTSAATLTISDAAGRTIISRTINLNESRQVVEIPSLTPGFYIARLASTTGALINQQALTLTR